MSGMLSNLTNPAHKEQLEQRMAAVREDPTLKPVLEEIETGGPAAMMKWVIFLIVQFLVLKIYPNRRDHVTVFRNMNESEHVSFLRYWNDPVVLSKLGQAMGVGVPGEGGLHVPGDAANDDDGEEGDEDEDELTVHHTASTGDVEVWEAIMNSTWYKSTESDIMH